MKRTLVFLMFIMTLHTAAFAEEEISVYLNNEKLTFIQPPIIRNDSTLVPFRGIFERLNMTVQWFDTQRRVTAEKEGLSVTLFIDSDTMQVNDETITLPTPPIIYNDYTLVPLRAISEAAGAQVEWDGDTRSVYITIAEEDFDDWCSQIFQLTNEVRTRRGLQPLKWDDSLAELAKAHCEDMIERGFVSHDNPDGESPFDRMKKAGIRYQYAGENIAAGSASPALALEGWMTSDQHRSNLLNPDFTYIGISVVRGGAYGIYWVQEFAAFQPPSDAGDGEAAFDTVVS